jgi:predicted ATPase
MDGWRLDLKQNLDAIQLVARRGGREGNLADSGQGIQQVLPVAALCCWRNLDRGGRQFLDIIEQPELHLHDAAHAPLGDLLLSAVKNKPGNILVETHSESVVLRVRRRIAEGLGPDQVAIIYVEDIGEGSRLRQIHLNRHGEVDWWPEGVFSESFLEVKAIRRAQREKAET